jgi:hypothetical protein
MKQLVAITFLFFSTFLLRAQTVENFKLPKDYMGSLDEILPNLGKDLNLRFVYDPVYLQKYRTSLMTNNERTVGGVLKMLGTSWDMVTLVGKDGYIYIAKDQEHLNELLQLKDEEKIVKSVSRKTLVPIKRNFLLSGEIRDIATGETIPFATIRIEGTTKGVLSDQNGHFALQNVPADTAVIIISYLGYHTNIIELEPQKENQPVNIDIKQQSVGISEVFIYGRKDDKALQKSVLEQNIKMSPVALNVLPNVGEKDFMRGFQLMPGVSAANEGSAGMYVRGGTPDQNQIIYDGFTVYNVDHLYGFYSAFNSNAIKDVQLHKGGFESKFGGRLSSVTEITGKDGNSKKPSFGAEVSLLSMNAYMEIPVKDRLTTLFAFRRSYQGYLYDKISDLYKSGTSTTTKTFRMGSNSKSDSYFYDFNGKITYKATDKDVLSLSFFNGTDYLDNTPQFKMPGERGGPGGGAGGGGGGNFPGGGNLMMENTDFTRYGNVGSSVKWTRKMNEKFTSVTLFSFSDFYSKRDERRAITLLKDEVTTRVKNGILEDNNLIDISIKNDWKYSFNEKNIFEFGAFGTFYDISYNYTQNDTINILNKYIRSSLAGGYAQDKMLFLNNKLCITPGLRANYFHATNKIYFEPRVNASYMITPKLSLNSATGIFYQFANRVVREDVMSGNRDFWILSNDKEIPVSSSTHLNLGINYDLQNYLFSAEGYYKRNEHVTEYSMRYRSIPRPGSSVQSTEQFFTGDGYAIGLELLAQKKAGNFNGWICYSLGEVKNRFPAQSNVYYYANHDVTNELKIVGIYKFGNFDFSASWIYATGRPYTAPLGAYTLKLIDGISADFYSVSDKNAFRLPDYHRFDVAASYRFNLFGPKGKQNLLSFSVFNLYNRLNVSSKQFQLVNNVILDSDISYLGITPNVSLTIKF